MVETLRFPVSCVDEVRMGGAEFAGEFVERLASDEDPGRRINLGILGVEFSDGRAPARCVTFAENFLKVAIQEFADSIAHGDPLRVYSLGRVDKIAFANMPKWILPTRLTNGCESGA